jgi:hypothetical protein
VGGDVIWLFGVGLSIDCGLRWNIPEHLRELQRDEKVKCIAEQLRAAMDAPSVNPAPIHQFLEFLSGRTQNGWRHRFLTTNWDFLLQREIEEFLRRSDDSDSVPSWMRDTHVFHLNGTIENLRDNARRSPFVLPEDEERTPSVEFNIAFSSMQWGRTFVVVGMGFECQADRSLFHFLRKVRDELPSGESEWVIVNPCEGALGSSGKLIEGMLPKASVKRVPSTFTRWREGQFAELIARGIFRE